MDPINCPLVIRRIDWQQMHDHVQKLDPEEACGLIAGMKGSSRATFDITNNLHSAERFRMDEHEQLRFFLWIEETGLELLAIYHSHPKGPVQPSITDLQEFAYPDVFYLIWFPENSNWNCRAFRMTDYGFEEVRMCVVDAE